MPHRQHQANQDRRHPPIRSRPVQAEGNPGVQPEEFHTKSRNSLELLFARYLEAYLPYIKDTRIFLTDKILVFLTNNFDIPALTVAELYRNRWRVELFFKWIKQHLKIKAFFESAPNAVKTQIWIAISIYVMVAMIRKMEKIELNLYTILQIFSVSLFEKVPIYQLLTDDSLQTFDYDSRKQLKLFELELDTSEGIHIIIWVYNKE
jgi:hypothetical protein